MGLFAIFSGRGTPRPFAPPPDTENRSYTPSPSARIEPTSGAFPVATPRFAPPEPSASPTPMNMYGVPIPLDGPSDSPRTVNPQSTTAKGVPIYRQGEK